MHFRFTKKWGVLDYKVWLSFIIVATIATALLGYKIATQVDCPNFKVSAVGNMQHDNDNVFFVNESVNFNTQLTDSKHEIKWDFGDKTPEQKGLSVTHTYTTPGSYLVSIIINGFCKETIAIRITQNPTSSQGSQAPDVNPIVSNDVLKIGDENIFVASVNTDGYEWSVLELPALGKVNTPTAKFIFTKAGNYTINLTLGDGKTYTKIVQVIDPIGQLGTVSALPTPTNTTIPPPPIVDEPILSTDTKEEQKPEPVSAPTKTYEQLPLPAIQAMLEDVIEGTKDVADFNNQLCNGAGTKVMANDKPTTFAGLCMDLKKKRKKLVVFKKEKNITSVKVVRDEANGNCISLMYVNYK